MAKFAVIVEDNPDHGEILSQLLEAIGWKFSLVTEAEAGYREAMDRKPDLLISDIDLPDGNGFDLCDRLKGHRELSGMRVLLVTGAFVDDLRLKRLGDLGVDAWLAKPFKLVKLVAEINRLCAA